MEYFKELSNYNILSLSDASKIIGNLPATKKYLSEMVKSGYLNKILKIFIPVMLLYVVNI